MLSISGPLLCRWNLGACRSRKLVMCRKSSVDLRLQSAYRNPTVSMLHRFLGYGTGGTALGYQRIKARQEEPRSWTHAIIIPPFPRPRTPFVMGWAVRSPAVDSRRITNFPALWAPKSFCQPSGSRGISRLRTRSAPFAVRCSWWAYYRGSQPT